MIAARLPSGWTSGGATMTEPSQVGSPLPTKAFSANRRAASASRWAISTRQIEAWHSTVPSAEDESRDTAPSRSCTRERAITAQAPSTGSAANACSSSERRNLPFYADIIRPQGITSQLVIAIDFHGGRRGTIHLCRHGPVSRIGSSLVQRLRPIVPALGLIDAAISAAPPSPRSAAPPSAPPSRTQGAREQEVAQFAARGLMTREIAALLGSSPATVRNQLHAIYRKLDVSNRTELAFVLASVQA